MKSGRSLLMGGMGIARRSEFMLAEDIAGAARFRCSRQGQFRRSGQEEEGDKPCLDHGMTRNP
jgi:hypothetical protein|tara:strand:+ start:1055 stop:1243 length:189 start_codon:yes stop_codon:yes gene_type:complete